MDDILEAKIKEKIDRFDVISLLKALASLGYQAEDIFFKANTSFSSATSLCKEIIFSSNYPRVTIILNLGLLAGNSALPTFFWKKMDEGSVHATLFLRFLSFFDHHMIKTFLSMGLAEENGYFFFSWKETLRQYLNLLALDSASTLEHLFQLSFPEFQVEVSKYPKVVNFQSSSIILGTTLLGENAFFEKNEKYTISTLRIVLVAHFPVTDKGWPFEIKSRIKKWLFPVIERVSTYLTIIFIDKNGSNDVCLSTRPAIRRGAVLRADQQLFPGGRDVPADAVRSPLGQRSH